MIVYLKTYCFLYAGNGLVLKFDDNFVLLLLLLLFHHHHHHLRRRRHDIHHRNKFDSDFGSQNIRKTLFTHYGNYCALGLVPNYMGYYKRVQNLNIHRREDLKSDKVKSASDIKLGKIQEIGTSQPSFTAFSRAVQQEINWERETVSL
jgi:hypothetical protein